MRCYLGVCPLSDRGSSRFAAMMPEEPLDLVAKQLYWQTPFEKVAWIWSWQFGWVVYPFGSIRDNPHWSTVSIHGITKSRKMLIKKHDIPSFTHTHPLHPTCNSFHCGLAVSLAQQIGPEYNFDNRNGPVWIDWFNGGKTNLSYNCFETWIYHVWFSY